MEEHFEYIGMDVGVTSKVAEERAEVVALFNVIIVLLLIMAFLLAVIGGLGLMGTMSINVLERTREIGVIRAIGASNRSVRRIFIIEGIIIGVLSWLVGAALAYPVSKFLGDIFLRRGYLAGHRYYPGHHRQLLACLERLPLDGARGVGL